MTMNESSELRDLFVVPPDGGSPDDVLDQLLEEVAAGMPPITCAYSSCTHDE